jgi:outer membrane lipoprotein carrier protein
MPRSRATTKADNFQTPRAARCQGAAVKLRTGPRQCYTACEMLLRAVLLATLALPASGHQRVADLVRGVELRYNRAQTLSALFLETYREGSNALRVESGTAYFRRPGLMRWDYDAPEQKLFLVDGKHVWFYIPADRTASRSSLKKSEDWRTPFALLTGKVRLSRLCGRIAILDDAAPERPSQPGNQLLACWPREKHSGFSEVLFEADPDYRLARIVIRQPGQVEVQIRFAKWQENVPLPRSLFRFEPPTGVAIVDQPTLGEGPE